jgi:hypothetical protein
METTRLSLKGVWNKEYLLISLNLNSLRIFTNRPGFLYLYIEIYMTLHF